MQEEKIRFKAVGYAMFAVAAGLALCRISSFFFWQAIGKTALGDLAAETILDTVFTLVSQVGVCLVVPFFIFKRVQKRTTKQILSDSNFKKTTKWWIPVLCIPLGIGCYFATRFVVTIWLNIIIAFGYNYNPGTTTFPATFNPALFLLSVFLTGVLPAICEEFAMRGNLVRTLRHTYRGSTVIVMAAIAFGLFHQEVMQVVYTAFFGALAALLVVKTGSILPAAIIHFVNNTLSVFLSYDYEYGWGLAKGMDKLLAGGGIFLFLLFGGALVVGCTALILRQAKRDNSEAPVLVLYKPTVRESAWYIGAMVIAIASTIFSFAFGLYL